MSENRRQTGFPRPLRDPRLGRVRGHVVATEDGRDYYFSCPCGWTGQGRSSRRGRSHAETCPYAQANQMIVDDFLDKGR